MRSPPPGQGKEMYTNLVHHLVHFLVANWVKLVCTLGIIAGIKWGGGELF
jgi:hypothetical protein